MPSAPRQAMSTCSRRDEPLTGVKVPAAGFGPTRRCNSISASMTNKRRYRADAQRQDK
jgi:hypothetical protein